MVEENNSKDQQAPKKPEQSGPEDIFAASANPNTRLTPVDPKPKPATQHPTVPLADKPAIASVPSPNTVTPPTRSVKRKGNKVMILMIIAIVVIVIFAASYIALRLIKPATDEGSNVVLDENTVVEEVIPENEVISEPVIEEVIIEDEVLDTDKDGLTDERERELGLDYESADTDNDGLSDKDEVDLYLSDPFNPDSDGDTFLDGSEVRRGYDPNGTGRLNDITNQGF